MKYKFKIGQDVIIKTTGSSMRIWKRREMKFHKGCNEYLLGYPDTISYTFWIRENQIEVDMLTKLERVINEV